MTRPAGAELLAFEGEIAIIIGRRRATSRRRDGSTHIGWVAPANDFGVYDFRWADRGSNVLAKGQDGFTPLGQPSRRAARSTRARSTLRTRVNGEVVQEDSTANLIFPFGLLVADLSRFITLEPGDVILTGTPAGSRPVEPGDVVEVELDGVGSVSQHDRRGARIAPLAFGAQPKVSPAMRAAALGSTPPRAVELSDGAKRAAQRLDRDADRRSCASAGSATPSWAGLAPDAARPAAARLRLHAALRGRCARTSAPPTRRS